METKEVADRILDNSIVPADEQQVRAAFELAKQRFFATPEQQIAELDLPGWSRRAWRRSRWQAYVSKVFGKTDPM